MNLDQFESQLVHLPDYLANHVMLTVAALGLGIAFSLPIAALAVRRPALASPLLGLASVVQTIPGLALLALMVPLLGRIGVVPALVALVLYSMLPILRNSITGALEVDANVIEAARGIGMTDGQILMRVQFPLAAPMIVAGVRTAAVWTVGMATLSTPVGATSLGNFIFSGLQTQNTAAVLLGCAGAAFLALGLDGLIRLGQLAAVRRDARLGWIAVVCFVLAVGIASAPLLAGVSRHDQRPPVTIGAKTFTEQYILAALLAERLRMAGFDVTIHEGLGSAVAFDALASGDIDVYIDYSGTIWANQMKRDNTPRAELVLAEIKPWLQAQYGIDLLGPLGFENAYALAMKRDRAESLGITTLADLSSRSSALSIGGDYEFFARPEWTAVRDRYGMAFREKRSLDSTLMYSAVANGHVDVITAFSSDGRIAAFDLVVLEDPFDAFPPYDAVLLLSRAASKNRALVSALTPLLDSLDDRTMRNANRSVDLDSRPIAEVARGLSAELPN